MPHALFSAADPNERDRCSVTRTNVADSGSGVAASDAVERRAGARQSFFARAVATTNRNGCDTDTKTSAAREADDAARKKRNTGRYVATGDQLERHLACGSYSGTANACRTIGGWRRGDQRCTGGLDSETTDCHRHTCCAGDDDTSKCSGDGRRHDRRHSEFTVYSGSSARCRGTARCNYTERRRQPRSIGNRATFSRVGLCRTQTGCARGSDERSNRFPRSDANEFRFAANPACGASHRQRRLVRAGFYESCDARLSVRTRAHGSRQGRCRRYPATAAVH